MKINQWVHIMEVGGDPWVLPIYSAINDAFKRGKIKKFPQDFGQLGLSISTRSNMFPRIIKRINEKYRKLCKEIANIDHKYISTPTKVGYAFKVDDTLKYKLLIDIDSFLFEFNSCCELMAKFLQQIYLHTGESLQKKDVGKRIQEMIEESGESYEWFAILDIHRNLFLHSRAPYVAVALFPNKKYDLLIMKENLHQFDDEEKFIRLSQLNSILKGFLKGRSIIQQNLIGYLKNL
ncbi:MAG: hypothetical protein JSV30_04860 [Candidatus Omnitrophota bacterium]|nr:MAG: hypothetical protein JSV30_04860 [Candidatus Omnitrophota bacterium]